MAERMLSMVIHYSGRISLISAFRAVHILGRVLSNSTHLTSYLLLSHRRTMTLASPFSVAVPGSNKTISLQTGLFINNEFVPSVDGLTIQ